MLHIGGALGVMEKRAEQRNSSSVWTHLRAELPALETGVLSAAQILFARLPSANR